MYSQNYRLRKAWLKKPRKSPLSEDPSTSNMLRQPNTVEICTAQPLPYILITVKTNELGKISHSDMQILKTVS